MYGKQNDRQCNFTQRLMVIYFKEFVLRNLPKIHISCIDFGEVPQSMLCSLTSIFCILVEAISSVLKL